ncbi:hypothetical protein RI578_06625 [Streptomyces sp. BB1-1-1]|uniref:hypothetical protein n=1 Tax=Streptomyces sp. BB1-1-1 TaxID=3074430 RepID=UPI00287809D7|nr:hypothetical protein [Streptomyces sp. BB1-1-1]WND33988.1 hypothetical protein RI578_06625 [Streptomyces sp. BB1-1-1]
MTETTVTPYPDTPAAVAAAVLDAIEAEPGAFDMSTWFWSSNATSLPPQQTPDCGTTMCAAGWAAHLTGWTLRGTVATKDGQVREIEDVARKALGLKTDSLFYTNADDAIETLRTIAGR